MLTHDVLDGADRDGRRPDRRAHAARANSRARRRSPARCWRCWSRCWHRRAISRAWRRRRCSSVRASARCCMHIALLALAARAVPFRPVPVRHLLAGADRRRRDGAGAGRDLFAGAGAGRRAARDARADPRHRHRPVHGERAVGARAGGRADPCASSSPAALALLLAGCASVPRRRSTPPVARAWRHRRRPRRSSTPEFWIDRSAARRAVVLDRAAIDGAEREAASSSIPRCTTSKRCRATLTRDQVRALDREAVEPPDDALFDEQGAAGPPRSARCARRRRSRSTRFRRRSPRATAWSCAARTCARSRRACACSTRSGDTDIDRFQESALFPGTPVVDRAREPRRRVVVRRQRAVRGLDREATSSPRAAPTQVFAYTRKAPYLVVTGATAHTVFTPRAAGGLGAAARHGRARAGARRLAGRASR